MTDDELNRLQALCDAATPGPWWVSDDGLNDVWNGEEEFAENLIAPGCVRHGEAPSERIRADQDFIAAARTALPELIAEVRRLRAEGEASTISAWRAYHSLATATGQCSRHIDSRCLGCAEIERIRRER